MSPFEQSDFRQVLPFRFKQIAAEILDSFNGQSGVAVTATSDCPMLANADRAVAAAVAAEREECARIADKYRDFFRNERDGLPEAAAAQFDVMAETLCDVSIAIRARGREA